MLLTHVGHGLCSSHFDLFLLHAYCEVCVVHCTVHPMSPVHTVNTNFTVCHGKHCIGCVSQCGVRHHTVLANFDFSDIFYQRL